MICSLCHTLFAQDKTPTQPRYIIEVDSQVIKATPYEITYENGRLVRHDENVDWHTDMTIYKFLPKEVEEKGMAMKSSSLKTTIFLLSGGGFTKWDNRYELDSTMENI